MPKFLKNGELPADLRREGFQTPSWARPGLGFRVVSGILVPDFSLPTAGVALQRATSERGKEEARLQGLLESFTSTLQLRERQQEEAEKIQQEAEAIRAESDRIQQLLEEGGEEDS